MHLGKDVLSIADEVIVFSATFIFYFIILDRVSSLQRIMIEIEK